MNKNSETTIPNIKNLDFLGLLLLNFMCPNKIELPEEFKEIYSKYSDKDGNVTDMENLMKDVEPVVRDYYNKCKEEFINNDRETSTN
jgi:hypothetical protein